MYNLTEETINGWKEIFEQKEEPYLSKVIYSASSVVVLICSLTGNTLICIVIYYSKSMHTAINYYLFNLAVSDLLVTFTVLTIFYQYLAPDNNLIENNSGVLTGKLYSCIQSTLLMVLWNHGILVMTALSIERYIAICYPMVLHSTPVRRRVCKIIVAIWILAILETFPTLWTMNLLKNGADWRCYFLLNFKSKMIATFTLVITFILPLGIMIFVYAMIAFKIRDHAKFNLNKTNVHNSSFKSKNVNKLIVTLTVSFVICWVPVNIIRTLMYFIDLETAAQFHWWIGVGHKIAMFNGWFTTVLNPLLFSIISTKFRHALKVLWVKKVRKYFQTKKMENIDTNVENLHI